MVRIVRPRAQLLVLQHPDETGQAKGSARLLQLCLAGSRIEVGVRFEPERLHAWLYADACTPVLLYPAHDGLVVDVGALPSPGRVRLVLVDATWRKSRRMLAENPVLGALPRLTLPSTLPARYQMRKAHRPGQLSTLEAACHGLALLEGDARRYAPVLEAFEGFVAAELARRGPVG